MGNRAVISTESNFDNNGIGCYVHWNGSIESVYAFLKYCEFKGYREPDQDNYGWARLCQVIGNFFGGECSVGIDVCSHLDCDNYDNGTYIIKGWKIVDRKYCDWDNRLVPKYKRDELYDRLCGIDDCMPEKEKLGYDKINKMLTTRN